jgi:hypothetical protein
VAGAIALFRLSYDRLTRHTAASPGAEGASATAEDEYDQIVEDSFPASDPPSGSLSLI